MDGPRLLALDLAGQVGFAYADRNGVKSGALQFAPKGWPVGDYLCRFEQRFLDMLRVLNPTYCTFEAPWVGERTSQDTARKLLGLACMVEYVWIRDGYDPSKIFELNVSSVRKHFCGVGKGPRAKMKALVMQACRDRSYDPQSEDEADALACLDYSVVCLRLDLELPQPGLLRRARND